ncbi:unnamed protein product (mitochondrion) [Plasmodiophora brassicae]|uniref:EF-hand domain-containing protein n=1 Tax=Plasmodiophora brassicae TaxID=37360 RepID=A0A0G4J0S5_PLABS|nr:hypothetical protein PBRA_008462 [Plasmodiophora brassicae]SPQ99447.1 unnamed protein product [Plasmodiophora brassicae]
MVLAGARRRSLPRLDSSLADALLPDRHPGASPRSARHQQVAVAVDFVHDACHGHNPRPIRRLARSSWTRRVHLDNANLVLALANASVIVLEPVCTGHAPTGPSTSLTAIIEALCLALLAIDLSIVCACLGPKRFLEKRWHLVQVVCLGVMMGDLLHATVPYMMNGDSGPRLRLSRPLRPVLVISACRPLRQFVAVALLTLVSMAHLLGLLVVIIVIYAMAGVALFADTPQYRDPAQIPYSAVQNFATFASASTALSVLVTTENFPDIYLPALHAHPVLATLYFLSFFVLGPWVIMSLVMADTYRCYRMHQARKVSRVRSKEHRSLFCAFHVLADEYRAGSSDPAAEQPAPAPTISLPVFVEFCHHAWPALSCKHGMNAHVLFALLDTNQDGRIELREFLQLVQLSNSAVRRVQNPVDSLHPGTAAMILQRGWTRARCTVGHAYYEAAVLGVYLVNAIVMVGAYDNPTVAAIIVPGCLAMMVVDVAMRIAAHGLLGALHGRPLAIGLVVASVPAELVLQGRALLLARALRLVPIVTALLGRVRANAREMAVIVTHMMSILGACFYVFAVIGMEMFSRDALRHEHRVVPDRDERFDSFAGACLAMFQMASSNNWQDNLYPAAMDTSLAYAAPFFIVVYIAINMIVINVFVANVIAAYTLSQDDLHQRVVIDDGRTYDVVVHRPWDRRIIEDDMPIFNDAEVDALHEYVRQLNETIREAPIAALRQ